MRERPITLAAFSSRSTYSTRGEDGQCMGERRMWVGTLLGGTSACGEWQVLGYWGYWGH